MDGIPDVRMPIYPTQYRMSALAQNPEYARFDRLSIGIHC